MEASITTNSPCAGSNYWKPTTRNTTDSTSPGEVRAGLRKHESRTPGIQLDGHPIGPWQMLEAQIADIADDITYMAHDTQDGLEAGLLAVNDLEQTDLWQHAAARIAIEYPDCPADRLIPTIVRCLFTVQIEDVLNTTGLQLAKTNPQTPYAAISTSERIMDFSPEMKNRLKPYKQFLFDHMYWHPSVKDANDDSVALMSKLFLYYIKHPNALGKKAQARLESEGLHRTVCDYVAGCTDRYALEECARYGLV